MSGPLVQALEKRRQEDLAKTQPLTPGTLEWAWAQAQKPFKGYWDRQGLMAREGLAMADQGAQQVQQGDLSGLAGMVLGPANYLSSPINALFPIEEAQTQLPKEVSPFVAGGLELMALAAPGPKGGKMRKVADAAEEGITAYHGSPHTDKVAAMADDYKMAHRPPSEKYGAPLHDLTQMFPEDVYGDVKNAANYYGHGLGELDRRAVKMAQQFKGKPDAEVIIYRAVPKDAGDAIGAGDWVTLDPKYAEHHGNGPLGGDYKVISQKVKASELWTSPDSIHEFGWHPPSSVTRDQALANLTEAPEGITAYHGSPHTFDKFDMSKIGTGEGAQAYGHGLYFAENEAVADGYRRTLGGKGLDVGEVVAKHYPDAPLSEDARAAIYSAATHGKPDPKDAARSVQMRIAELRDDGRSFLDTPGEKGQKLAAAISDIREIQRGYMYQVRLNVKPDELLDWDRPLSEQPIAERTKEILKSSGIEAEVKQVGLDPMSMTGEGLHGWIRDPKQATKATEQLKAAGIKGIRYKDAGSRGGEGGTYNYVIFDDKLVDILKRYAIPFTLGAGGAAIVSGQDMPPEVASQLGPQA